MPRAGWFAGRPTTSTATASRARAHRRAAHGAACSGPTAPRCYARTEGLDRARRRRSAARCASDASGTPAAAPDRRAGVPSARSLEVRPGRLHPAAGDRGPRRARARRRSPASRRRWSSTSARGPARSRSRSRTSARTPGSSRSTSRRDAVALARENAAALGLDVEVLAGRPARRRCPTSLRGRSTWS